MAKSQNKTCLSILRSIIGSVSGGEARFAKTIGRSRSWVKKASAGIIPISEDAAVRISHETGVCYNWLLKNDPKLPAVCIEEDVEPWNWDPKEHSGKLFTRETYDDRRLKLKSGLTQSGSTEMVIYDLYNILSFISLARDKNKLQIFERRLVNFIHALEHEFGVPDIDSDEVSSEVEKYFQMLYEYIYPPSRLTELRNNKSPLRLVVWEDGDSHSKPESGSVVHPSGKKPFPKATKETKLKTKRKSSESSKKTKSSPKKKQAKIKTSTPQKKQPSRKPKRASRR